MSWLVQLVQWVASMPWRPKPKPIRFNRSHVWNVPAAELRQKHGTAYCVYCGLLFTDYVLPGTPCPGPKIERQP